MFENQNKNCGKHLTEAGPHRNPPHHFVWFAEAPGSPVPFVVSETAPLACQNRDVEVTSDGLRVFSPCENPGGFHKA